MGEMPMHAGDAVSMWTRMPGQTWPGFAASLLGMWMTMMVPMMIPPFAVMLRHYRQTAVRNGATRLGTASVFVALGYFVVWSGIGILLLPMVAASAGTKRGAGLAGAWRDGIQLGIGCARSCAPLMAIAFVFGGSDIRVMAVVTAAITAAKAGSVRRKTSRVRLHGSRQDGEAVRLMPSKV